MILDHIDDIRVAGDDFSPPCNEYWQLACLWHGMEWLHSAGRAMEERAQKDVADAWMKLIPEGLPPMEGPVQCIAALRPLPTDLRKKATCAFHWYAVSACQYVRTVGTIAARNGRLPNKYENPRRYVERVIPSVFAFRNKVAGHFVWTLNDERDSDAEREASILPQVGLKTDRLIIGAWQVSLRRAGQASSSDAIEPWSLTEEILSEAVDDGRKNAAYPWC